MNEQNSHYSDKAPAATMHREAEQSDEIDLAQLWGILWAGRWKIVSVLGVVFVLALCYLFIVAPTYRADALIQIKPEGSSPLQGLTSDLKQQLTGKNTSPAQSEIPIIKSRSVIGKTVNQLSLDTIATANHFPVIGGAIVRRREMGEAAQKAVPPSSGWWLSHYAWQPANLEIGRMQVPSDLQGKAFTLRALGGGQYVLYGPDGDQVLKGSAGHLAKGRTAQGGQVQLFVTTITVSAPPTDFTVTHKPWLSAVDSLQGRLQVAEQGNETGIVRIALEGDDRAHITKIVNSVAQNYLKQNVEAKSKQAQKSLKFLDDQLPQLKSDVESAEARLANYKEKNESAIDLDAEGKSLLDQAVNIQDKTSKLKMKIAELRQSYTGKHPTLEAARDQMAQLKQQRQEIENKIGKLPDAQKKILQLKRDLQVNTELYTSLLNRAQQLRVAKAGTVGNVRIVDKAVSPVQAVSPKKLLIMALAIVLGGILGCGFVLLRAALHRGVNDPKEIENKLGLPVYAIVPFSSEQARASERTRRRREQAPLLAQTHGDEVAVEALRSLRTSLYFAQMESDSNAILITGSAPGVGKSFVSMNLAYLLAETGQKVVVVDADMRKGRLHEFLPHRQREPGLSQVLSGQVTGDDALHKLPDTNVSLLTSGQIPPNPSELLMRERFGELIERLKAQFDLVLVDAPPILAVTDAAVIAATVPGIATFMVARAGAHSIPELDESVKRMSQRGSKVSGVVFNGYKQEHAAYAGGGAYYKYEYSAQVGT